MPGQQGRPSCKMQKKQRVHPQGEDSELGLKGRVEVSQMESGSEVKESLGRRRLTYREGGPLKKLQAVW